MNSAIGETTPRTRLGRFFLEQKTPFGMALQCEAKLQSSEMFEIFSVCLRKESATDCSGRYSAVLQLSGRHDYFRFLSLPSIVQ